MDVMKAFQARLLDARELAGLSQTSVAKAIGETLPSGKGRGPTIYEWEKGKRVPSADQLAKLVDLYGVSGHWLLTGEGPMRPDQDADTDAVRLEVIGRVVDGDISAEAVKLFVQAVAEQDKDADPASSQVEFAKIVREVRWPVAPPEESGESTHNDPPEDPPTDKKSG